MQFSEKWLREYVNPEVSSENLAKMLTMAGSEVEKVEAIRSHFSGVVVGHIQSVAEHPNAGRLKVCQVAVAADQILQIVCGADNVVLNAKVACALVGARLADSTIERASLRGVDSFGMLCSARELGLSGDVEGLLFLPNDAAVGTDVRDLLNLDDHLFTIKVTPNRGDCLSLLGVAREVSALTGSVLKMPPVDKVVAVIPDSLTLVVSAPEACPKYFGRIVRGVDCAVETPSWMRLKIERSGLRCINVIVDIVNYVMLELGQPLHAFDASKLTGGIEVRWARAGETITLLNERLLQLTPDLLVIADELRPVAFAGVMGDLESSVLPATKDIFLESAFFVPKIIAGKARKFNLNSEAAHRFERGVDSNLAALAIERATKFILEICGGLAGPVTAVESLPNGESENAQVRLRFSKIKRVLGFELSLEVVRDLLQQANFNYKEEEEVFILNAPSHRFDLRIEEDWIGEIARLYGYERIPAKEPLAALNLASSRMDSDPQKLQSRLVACGYKEVMTYGFISEEDNQKLSMMPTQQMVRLQNPIASHLNVMRATLWSGLIETLRYNLDRRQERLRIFEMGRCFWRKEDGEILQPMKVGGLIYGNAYPLQWGVPVRPADFFDLKGDVEKLLVGEELMYVPAEHPTLHPGRSAALMIQGRLVGYLGELHPQLQRHYGLPEGALLFEFTVEGLSTKSRVQESTISKFPAIRRDIALVVDDLVPAGAILKALREAAPSFVSDIQIFDLFKGGAVPSGKKSLAFLIVMQDTQRTLTDFEADSVLDQFVKIAEEKFQAALRLV